MNLITTVTTKGQVVIPKSIRDAFDIQPFTKVTFEVVGGEILVKPALTVAQMAGFIKTKPRYPHKSEKEIIQEAVVEKFEKKSY